MPSLDLILDIASGFLFVVGGVGVIVGAIGIIRFPDFYTRLHAAGITDTAGAELILLGMILQSPNFLIAAKLVFIGFFLFMTSPVSTHAIAHAAWVVGLRPMLGKDLKREGDGR
jgi:multicomponent Na+:H+ antiporter subunit G